MKYLVRYSAPAEAEAEDAYLWIHKQSPFHAAKWLAGLLEAIASLESNPESYPLAPEADTFHRPIRQRLYGKRRGIYRILFEIEGRVVKVLHIRHGARRGLEP
jgi:plasmid stabilization system protein ParE